MATWAATKVEVDRKATPPEQPMVKLAAALQAVATAGGTLVAVCQDITDSSWVLVYYT